MVRRAAGGDRFAPLWQAAYWTAFRLARCWWRLRRPAHEGALVAVWHGDRLLLVRQSYRRCAMLPGGGVRRGEDPREAARRELAEEVGLHVPADNLVPAHEETNWFEDRHDHVHIFELHLPVEPALAIDNREITGASFVTREAALAAELPTCLRNYLCLGGAEAARPRRPGRASTPRAGPAPG